MLSVTRNTVCRARYAKSLVTVLLTLLRRVTGGARLAGRVAVDLTFAKTLVTRLARNQPTRIAFQTIRDF